MRVVAIGEALLGHRHRAAGAFGDVLPRHLGVDAARDRALGAMHREEAAYLGQDPVERPRLVAAIGRASCRERVCQYVLISVVAVSLKKNKQTQTYKKKLKKK